MIPYGRQDIRREDIDAVVAVLKSGFLTQGPAIPAFEKVVADKVGAAHAVAVNSATSALHIACLALDLGPGDLLWTSPITFVASANCGVYCGADVDFVDIDPDTYNMSPARLADKLKAADKAGCLPKVVVPVHMCGRSCDMAEIGALAQQYGVHVVEDASHAIGGRYGDAYVGACQHSDITVFSFHPVKIVTTAEGGIATTQDDALAAKLQRLRSHGVTRDPSLMSEAPDGPWYYEQIELGWNYRITDIQAALGATQMKRVDEYVARRNWLATRYEQLLGDQPLSLPRRDNSHYSAFHLYVIQLDDPSEHLRVFEALRANGIGVNLHYIPVHLQPFYRQRGFSLGDFPVSEAYYARAISLPLFPTMTEAQQDTVVAELTKALGR